MTSQTPNFRIERLPESFTQPTPNSITDSKLQTPNLSNENQIQPTTPSTPNSFPNSKLQTPNFFFLVFVFLITTAKAQTIGGETVFSFLNLPAAPQTTALGGIHLSNANRDVGLVFGNPSLLRKEHHGQVQVAYNSFLAGIDNYFVQGAWHVKKWETTLGL